ncbi:flagellar hook-associated protein FlgL [Pseudoduganella umbonata]|uniref:Flagellar hook-associated protein 3 n=1 Tax=Pseudoduganella umbonata TaxID=864828 RepID=A0A4P8HSD0_9BURK|nr:flagellar hook-associated protein FlgL [Pseudoduganella umbonata]MBB3225101.1 flagellar hook-associated protein 3 FlgL [Pseudoduganella umbonata]QCP11430.1 flagellar hook-associated protein 3 [Pseudoduganella umbonata]
MAIRISTQTMYDRNVSQLANLQGNMLRTQMQLSTDRRVLTPADDPVASARALEVTQSQQMNEQFELNRQNANASLSQVDTVMQSVSDIMEAALAEVVRAGNPGQGQSDRDAVATALEGQLNDLLGQANSADGTGGYLFSGFKTNTQPFALTSTGATYFGDQGQRELQVGSGRQMAISASGSQIFEQNLTGNGTFQTKADPGNAERGGTGIIAPGSVIDASALTGDNYTVNFTKDATTGLVQFSVTNTTDGTEAVPLTDFKAGEPITFDGLTFDIAGAPADGDIFTIEPSKNQSVFATIRDVITALREAGTGPTAGAQLTNALNTANQNLQNAQDNVLSVVASVGARQNELDSLDLSGSALDIEYVDQITNLVGLTTRGQIAAVSLFQQQTTSLTAAQQTFRAATQLSLFNYI